MCIAQLRSALPGYPTEDETVPASTETMPAIERNTGSPLFLQEEKAGSGDRTTPLTAWVRPVEPVLPA